MLINTALLIAISAAWAAGYLFIGAATKVPPVTATALMTVMAALVIVPGVRFGLNRRLLPTLRQRPWVPAVMGLSAIALPNMSVVVAEHSVPADLAAVLGTTVPIATMLLVTCVTREMAYSSLRMLGIAIALAGLVIFVGWRDLFADSAELWGIATMMAGGVIFACNGLLAARQTRDLEASVLAAWTIMFGAAYLSLAAFIFERPPSLQVGSAMWPLIGEGILGMGLAYLGYYVLVARAGAGFASLYAFLVPVLGVLASSLAFGEPVSLEHAAGLATVLVGLLVLTQADALRAMMISRRLGGRP
jgi:drug/metabolite transporter (DMT)-like permease